MPLTPKAIYQDLKNKDLDYTSALELLITLIGSNAEAICKKIIEMKLTDNLYHINYLGRELEKAENCLFMRKPYIQDE